MLEASPWWLIVIAHSRPHLIRSLSLQLGSQAQSLLSTSWPRLRLDRLGPSRMRENNLLHNEIQRNQTHKYRHMPELHANLKRTNSGIPLLDLITDSQDSVVLAMTCCTGEETNFPTRNDALQSRAPQSHTTTPDLDSSRSSIQWRHNSLSRRKASPIQEYASKTGQRGKTNLLNTATDFFNSEFCHMDHRKFGAELRMRYVPEPAWLRTVLPWLGSTSCTLLRSKWEGESGMDTLISMFAKLDTLKLKFTISSTDDQ